LDGLYHLYDAIQDIILVVDCTTCQILHANQAAQETTGYSLAQFRSMTLSMLCPELDQARLGRDLARLRTQPQVRYEEPLRLYDGSLIMGELRINLGRIEGVEYLICVVFNLWNQQMVERKLQDSRVLYRSLMDAVPDLLFRIRRDGTYLDYKVPENLGLPIPKPEDILGKKIAEVVPEHVAQLAIPAIERVARDGVIETIEYSIMEPDGRHYYEARFVPSAEQEVIAVVRDITRHKHTEAALRTSEEMTRTLLNASEDVAILATPEGLVLAANEPAARRFGMSVEDLIGKCVFDHMPAEVATFRKAIADRILRTESPLVFEDSNRGACFVNSAFPLLDADGRVFQMAIFARDVTEERRTQGILKRRRSLLEGVAGATNRLLVNLDYEVAIVEALQILGKAMEVDQVFICERCSIPSFCEEPMFDRFEQTHRWKCSERTGETSTEWETLDLSEWHDKSVYGKIITGPSGGS